MPDITGARTTTNVTSGLRRTEVDERIYELEPSAAPLTVLSARLNNRPTNNPEYKHYEDSLETRFDAINGSTGTGTDLVVDTPSLFAEHALWKNTRTGEIMRVQAVTAGTSTVTFVRGVGASAVAAADNDELMHVGWAQPENDTSRPARSKNPTAVTNYTQIVRTPYEASRTWRQSATFTAPSDWDRQSAHAMIEHQKDWEQLAWHGKPSENTSGSAPRRTTGGFFHYVTTNVTNAGGTFTEAEFFGTFSSAFRYGSSGTKTAFASRLAVEVVNGFPRGKLEVVQGDNDTTYGLNVTRYVSPHGTLNFVTANMLEGSVYGGYIAYVDLQNFARRPLVDNQYGSADTHIRENIQPNDQDGRKDEILTEAGFQVSQEKSHAYVYGITG